MNKAPQGFISKNKIPLILIVAGLLMAFTKPLYSVISPSELDIQILQAPVVMPSIYKVYANDEALEGKYSLFKMIIKNTSNKTSENVEVSYEIPNYISSTVCQKIARILPGQTVVVNCFPSFPDKVVEKTTSSKETVNITVKGANIKTVENSFPIQFKGRNEFVYSFIPADEIRTGRETFDNLELLSCLVTPEDPIIKYLTQKIQEKVLKGEVTVNGNEKEGLRFMMGVYEATLRAHLVYSGTSGVPEKIGDVSTMTQSIRLPREVITGKTGLCIELSLLYASVMMCAGMDPVVYLVPGHAYPGFRMNGQYYAIESTAIGGEGIGGKSSPEQAVQAGLTNLKKFIEHAQAGDPDYMILDVREAIKMGALAMELKDDAFLRTKIDEVAQSFDGSAIATNVPLQTGVPEGGTGGDGGGGNDGGGGSGGGGTSGGGGNGGNNGGGTPAGYNLFEGNVTFAYPASWKMAQRNQYFMRQMTYVFENKSRNTHLEVYNFPGYSNATQAISAIQQHVGNYGYTLTYQVAGQSNGYTVLNGTTASANSGVNWVAAFKNTGNGIGGIAIGASFGVNAEATAQKILGTLR